MSNIKCPKCNYIRNRHDSGPEWKCPRCGIVYSKLEESIDKIKERNEIFRDRERRKKAMGDTNLIILVTSLLCISVSMYQTISLTCFFLMIVYILYRMKKYGFILGNGATTWDKLKEDAPLSYKIEVIIAKLLILYFLYLIFKSLY